MEAVLAKKSAAEILREILEQCHGWQQKSTLAISNQKLATTPRECLRERIVAHGHFLRVCLHPLDRALIAFIEFSWDKLFPGWVANGPMKLVPERLKPKEVSAKDVLLTESW